MNPILLQVDQLTKYFPVKSGILQRTTGQVHAVEQVSFEIRQGETLGLVGESGCGKSTLGRTIVKLYNPTAGRIQFEGKDLAAARGKELKLQRRDLQMIFQDPYESLNTRHTVGRILEEPLIIHRLGDAKERSQRVKELLQIVGLREDALNRYPHEFSGGQRQRIGIARALMLNPKMIVCDEPVSALDVSIQSQILNLLVELQKKFNLSYLFISHNLSVVRYIADHVAVMYLGRIVELARSEDLFLAPKHPYTQALLSAIPIPDPKRKKHMRQRLQGEVPSPISPPSGCHFHTRCPFAQEICRTKKPEIREMEGTVKHKVACHFPL